MILSLHILNVCTRFFFLQVDVLKHFLLQRTWLSRILDKSSELLECVNATARSLRDAQTLKARDQFNSIQLVCHVKIENNKISNSSPKLHDSFLCKVVINDTQNYMLSTTHLLHVTGPLNTEHRHPPLKAS